MSAFVALLSLMLLAAVMAVVSRPLLTARKPEEPGRPERSELEAEREAKYREIRDAELDYRTGKLSQEDYATVNGTLRAEAVEILNKLESSEAEDEALEEDQATNPTK
jgi:hypothetical protein